MRTSNVLRFREPGASRLIDVTSLLYLQFVPAESGLERHVVSHMWFHLVLVFDLVELLVFAHQDDRLASFDTLLGAAGVPRRGRFTGGSTLRISQPAREFRGGSDAERAQQKSEQN